MKSSPSIWHSLHIVKSTVKIPSIFVAFLENRVILSNPSQNIWTLPVVDSVIKAVSTLHTMFKDFPILVNERQKKPR